MEEEKERCAGEGSLEEGWKGTVKGEGSPEQERRGGREPEPGRGRGTSAGRGEMEGGAPGWGRGTPEGRGRGGGSAAVGVGAGWSFHTRLPHSLLFPSTQPPSFARGAGGWARRAFVPEPAARAVPRPGWRSGPFGRSNSASCGRWVPRGDGHVRDLRAGSAWTPRAKRRTLRCA